MKKILFAFLFFSTSAVYAQETFINNFIIKESLLQNSKLAIIATDSLGAPKENINGQYTFSISGFTQKLSFNNGIAIIPQQMDKSSFVYIKHENDKGTHGKLLYVFKKNGHLNPIVINTLYFILIPIIIIILAFAFKKLIYFALILFLIIIIFGYVNGLNFSITLETVFDYLKSLV